MCIAIFRFFVDLVAAVQGQPAHRDEISRRAVASPRLRCVSAFSADTFPAVPAQEPAVTSTCRASLKACPSTLGRPKSPPSATIHCRRGPWRVRGFARSRSGCRERGLTRRSGERHASRRRSKNRDGILPRFTPSPHPRLHLHRPACRGVPCGVAVRPIDLPAPRLIIICNQIHEEPKKTPFTALTPCEAILFFFLSLQDQRPKS